MPWTRPSSAGRIRRPRPTRWAGRRSASSPTRSAPTDPAYHDPEAARALGYPDVVAPPTFPVVLTMAASRQIIDDPALGMDYSRVVHGDQRFAYTRPVVAGDELVCVSTDRGRSAAGAGTSS